MSERGRSLGRIGTRPQPERRDCAALIICVCSLVVSSCTSISEPNPQTQRAAPSAGRVLEIVERRTTTLIELTTKSAVVTTTPEHPFAKVGFGWTRAERLVAGDRILNSQGRSTPILHTRRIDGPSTPVFNLVVQGSHTYYVSEDELLVHNLGCGMDIVRNWFRPATRAESDSTEPPPRSPTSEIDPNGTPRERAKRWARENPWPGEWPNHPEPGSLGTTPTRGELSDLEAYRSGTKLRPPPGTLERRRLDEVEATVTRREQTYPEGSPWKPPEDPRERAKRWARETPWPAGQWPERPEPGSLGSPPTLRELTELEAYRDGSKLRPPPGTTARRRLDELDALVRLDESVHGGSSRGGSFSDPESAPGSQGSPRSDGSTDSSLGDPPERAKRWARKNPWPDQWPARPEPGAPGTPPTLRELMDLESFRDGTKLRPPPGTPERRRVDELESTVSHWEQSQPSSSTAPENPRERARRWARDVPWPGTLPEPRTRAHTHDQRPAVRELLDVEAYRAGTKLRPPPGTPERRRVDDVDDMVKRWEQTYPEKSPWKPPDDPRERARRWARKTPFPGQWPERPEPGALGSPPTLHEIADLQAYRDGTKLRPPPGTLERRRLDEVEAIVVPRAPSPEQPSPEAPREAAKRWARETPWPGE